MFIVLLNFHIIKFINPLKYNMFTDLLNNKIKVLGSTIKPHKIRPMYRHFFEEAVYKFRWLNNLGIRWISFNSFWFSVYSPQDADSLT